MNTLHSSNVLDGQQSKTKQLLHFFKAVPHLEFSDKGLENISRRFNISINHLKAEIQNYRSGGQKGIDVSASIAILNEEILTLQNKLKGKLTDQTTDSILRQIMLLMGKRNKLLTK